MPNENGWTEWGKYVLKSIEDLSHKVDTINEKLSKIDKRLTIIEVKAGFLGGLAGFIAAVIMAYIKSHI